MSAAIQSPSAAGCACRAAEVSTVSRRHEQASRVQGPEDDRERKHSTGRHALVAALHDALAGLMQVGQTGRATQASAGQAVASGAPVGADDRKQALHEFLHELFSALRPTGGEGGAKRHHGHGFAWGRASAGDLAQRLEALAQSLGGAAPPASADAAAPTTSPAPVAVKTTQATPAADGMDASAAVAPADVPTRAPILAVADPAKGANPPSGGAIADTPLLTAFTHLVAAPKGGTVDAATSPADRLAALLHQMAQALQSRPGSEVPVAGSLIDVSA